MARTAVTSMQPIWECRWSQPGYRLHGVEDPQQPEALWVCTREGGRRNVNECECVACVHWEPDPDETI
jgi:hypothetical protein